MNDLGLFIAEVKRRLNPDNVRVDMPAKSNGSHWVDIKNGPKRETVEWKPDLGFGFFAYDSGYGEGPNLIVASWEVAYDPLQGFMSAFFLATT